MGAFNPQDHSVRIGDLNVRLPSFLTGGTMPGPPGRAGLAVLHGGEHVQPREIPLNAGNRSTVEHHVTLRNEWTINATGEVRLTGRLKNDVQQLMEQEANDAARLYRQGVVRGVAK